jgi:hypothetical protein
MGKLLESSKLSKSYPIISSQKTIRMQQNQIDKLNLLQRATAPTPGFFKKLRNLGLLLTAISAAIITAPVAVPAFLVTAAGYIGLSATVISAVSQLTVQEDQPEKTDG